MSYILDALRKADAERLRGTVPGLHTQPIQLERDQPRERGPRSAWSGVVLGAAAVAVAAVAWRIWSGPADGPPAAPPTAATSHGAVVPPTAAGTTAATAVAGRSAAESVEARSGTAPAHAAAPVGGTPVAPAATAGAKPSSPAPSGEPTTTERAGSTDARDASSQRPTTPAAPSARTAKRPENAPAPTISRPLAPAVPRDELPDDIKRQLPPLNVGGSMYSPQASQRMLIVNGEVVREGQPAGAGLVLERVNPRSAVLRFREHRFEISF